MTLQVINALILSGTKLSNICYNMKQDENLPLHVRQSMEECVRAWDAAVSAHYAQVNLLGKGNI